MSAAALATADSSAPTSAKPDAPLQHYKHSTFLHTLNEAVSKSVEETVARCESELSEEGRKEVTPDFYVESLRAALKQLLEKRYQTEVVTETMATLSPASPSPMPQPSPVPNMRFTSEGAVVDETTSPKRKPVRTYIDGCFDIMHSGHYNAIRQAKALTDILVVGVHSDKEIRKHKGPPVMSDEERLATVRACKWVDEVVFDTPYDPSLELLLKLNCDFAVHGDDTSTTADGKDAFAELKEAGRMKIVKRTEGVSTTDLVGRLLLMTKQHHLKDKELEGAPNSPNVVSSDIKAEAVYPSAAGAAATAGKKTGDSKTKETTAASTTATAAKSSHNHNTDGHASSSHHHSKPISNFLPTTWRITQFSNHKVPSKSDKIVYIDGAFDLFHVGHIETLKAAKALGTFLYVGVHDDATVNLHKGRNYPIMNLHERVMNVLSCRYVDEVVIGAPWVVTKDLITTLNLHVVASGTNSKIDQERESALVAASSEGPARAPMGDAYAAARASGIFREIETTHALTTEDVVTRLIQNRTEYEQRNAKRAPKESAYLAGQKQFVQEI